MRFSSERTEPVQTSLGVGRECVGVDGAPSAKKLVNRKCECNRAENAHKLRMFGEPTRFGCQVWTQKISELAGHNWLASQEI